MTEALHLRPAAAPDAPACARIISDWIDATDWMPRLHTTENITNHYRDTVFVERIATVADGEVLGLLALDGGTDEITALFVKLRGRGIGTTLLQAAKTGRDQLSMWMFQANMGARRFYARHGFAELERSDGENDEALPDIRLGWRAEARA